MIPLNGRPLRIAAAQAAAVPGDVEHNVATAARLIGEASARGVDVVVFPELFLCCYDLRRIREDPERCDIDEDDPRIEPIRHACRAGSVTAVVSGAVRANGGRTISALVIGDDGTLRARYDKQHVDESETPLFAAGRTGCTFGLDEQRLAIGICRDARFPEHARAARSTGAGVYLCPSSETEPLAAHAERARENAMYVVVSNHVGAADGRRLCGQSAVYDRTGAIVAAAGPRDEALVVADLEP